MLSSVPLRRANKFIFLKNTLWSSGGGLIDNLFIFLDGFQQGQTDILHPGRQPRKTSSTRIRIEQTDSCNYNDRWASLGNHHQRESRTDKTDSYIVAIIMIEGDGFLGIINIINENQKSYKVSSSF